MSTYIAVAGSALIDGIFYGYYLRTGIDASPSALGARIINLFGSLSASSTIPQPESYKFLIIVSPWIITALPWIFTAIMILMAPSRILAGIIFVIVCIASTLFVGYYNA